MLAGRFRLNGFAHVSFNLPGVSRQRPRRVECSQSGILEMAHVQLLRAAALKPRLQLMAHPA